MAITSTTFTTIAAAIVTLVDTASTVGAAYGYEPRDFDSLPAVCVLGPEGERREPDDPDSQLGSVDLHTRWILRAYANGDDPATAATQLRQVMGELVGLVDASTTISTTLEAVVSTFRLLPDPFVAAGTDRQLFMAELELHSFSLH